MSENGEIYTAGKNFTLPPAPTAWTNSTSVLLLFHCPAIAITILNKDWSGCRRPLKIKHHRPLFMLNAGFFLPHLPQIRALKRTPSTINVDWLYSPKD